MKKLQILLVACMALLFVGCSSEAEDSKKAVKAYDARCNSMIKAEFYYNTWSKGVVLTCEDFDLNK